VTISRSLFAASRFIGPLACAAMLSACQSPQPLSAPHSANGGASQQRFAAERETLAPIVDAVGSHYAAPASRTIVGAPLPSPALPSNLGFDRADKREVRLVEHRETASADASADASPLAPVIDASSVSLAQATLGPTSLPPTLPPEAFTGHPGDGNTIPAYAGPLYQGPYRVDMPGMGGPVPPWAPPGSARPFPPDEYIFDGGDRDLPVAVNADLSVRGLDQDDTVVHYDTVEGETIVKPSNRVCIYAPRFASVRRTYGVDIQEQRQKMLVIDKPERIVSQELRLPPTTVMQPVEVAKRNGVDIVDIFEERQRGVEFDRVQTLVLASEMLMPFEDLHFVRFGVADNAEKPRLAASIDAAITWTENQAVQVVVDEKAVDIEMGIESADTLIEIKRYGKPCVRICKLASRKAALPGDEIDFTLRFDNIGTDLASNVTIIDNLTTRLEYVPGSAQCTLAAEFETEANEGDTLVLRWKLQEQLLSGKGGVIRFKCRVR
jgi:uncharacterized repeat protein (TIGR01451 family)